MAENDISDYVILRVIGPNYSDLLYKVRKHRPFKTMMYKYCLRNDLNYSSAIFHYCGRTLRCTDTPSTLGMEKFDEMEVHVERYD